MWDRGSIKARAKNVLTFTYWKAFGVSLIIALVGGSHSGGGSGSAGSSYRRHLDNYGDSITGESIITIGKVTFYLALIVIFLVLLRVLLGYMLEVGGRKFFVRASEGDANFGYLGYCFKDGRYLNVFVTMFLRSIFILLWSLLLIIPGIIKTYAYRMVPYILADNPKIGYTRAIELSNEMTKGEKWDIFVLDLSFIGWYLLGSLALFIGVLFVLPYEDATNAELYLILRKDAIDKGLTSHSELNLIEES